MSKIKQKTGKKHVLKPSVTLIIIIYDIIHRKGSRKESSYCSVLGFEDILGKTVILQCVTQTTKKSPSGFKSI